MSFARLRLAERLALVIFGAFILTTVIMLFIFHGPSADGPYLDTGRGLPVRHKTLMLNHDSTGSIYEYSRDMPLFFIGGMPRSGTTLLRVMLESHPDIRCGGESRVIPRIINMRNSWLRNPIESERLREAGVTSDVIDSAIGEFILEVIVRHGKPAKRLCNKDPFTLKYATLISSMFPNAQFLYIIRDGRAVAHSIVSRNVTISGFNYTNYRDTLSSWNLASESMYGQCIQLGPKLCLPVYYESLVLHPEVTMRGVLKFLNIDWNDDVLHHEDFISSKVDLPKLERSTDQVVKPINTEMLSKWVGQIPGDVIRDIDKIAPMLSVLGYDTHAYPPKYGDPDSFVKAKMKSIQDNDHVWRAKQKKLIEEREKIRSKLMAKSKKSSAQSTSTGTSTATSTDLQN